MELDDRQISEDLRWCVLKRDHYRCRYCGRDIGPFHMDHVYPHSRGGETSYKNLVTACQNCNNKKRDEVGMWPMPIGYFDDPKEDMPLNGKMGLMILFGVMAIVNAYFFDDQGVVLVAIPLFVIGLFVSMWGVYRLLFGSEEK